MQSRNSLQDYARLIQRMASGAESLATTAKQIVKEARKVSKPLGVYSQLVLAESNGRRDVSLRQAAGELDDSLWSALARRLAGEMFDVPDWIENSRSAFDVIVHMQQASGAFLSVDLHANPESRWYEELMLLHAVQSYAVLEPTEALRNAVKRSAQFHLNETQPDHATAEPWGLLAFMQYAPPLADQVLHAVSMQYPQGATGAALLLLADVQYGLQRISRDGA